MSKIRLGVLGGGGDSLIGVLHRVASYMYDRYEIVGGVFNPDYEENIKFAKQIGVNTDRVYKDFDAFVAEESAKPEGEKVTAKIAWCFFWSACNSLASSSVVVSGFSQMT